MTGTGTENDPYIVDNWEDFQKLNFNSSYVKWADSENKIIDFNDIMPEGYTETVNFNGYFIDFNGWTFKNFHSTADIVIGGNVSQIKNLIFKDFYIFSAGEINCIFNAVLENCVISGVITAEKATFTHDNITDSALNLKITLKNDFTLVKVSGGNSGTTTRYITGSKINIDILSSYFIIGNAEYYDTKFYADNNIFTGKMTFTGNKAITLQGGNYNIFALKSNYVFLYQGSGLSLYNSELAHKNTKSTDVFIGCTTKQLKDPAYLYNSGFPAGVSDD
ncbi:MAG: hypothetical protein HDT23_01405 [Ruminococcus sp.]|nr:hypothetical protein [Ruminococcus sp.]